MSSDVPKKILWIFVFLILAAMAVLGVLFIRGFQSSHQVASVSSSSAPDVSATPQAQLQLQVSNPSADVATSSAKLTVAGTATQGALVAITGGASDQIVPVNNEGSFSIPVTLSLGLNSLQITAFMQDGSNTSVKHNIVYSKSL